MSIIKRKWSEAQKLQIIQEAEQGGLSELLPIFRTETLLG